jgi:NADPH-dependent glutamate synthase beta subunit-like oxidoreductase
VNALGRTGNAKVYAGGDVVTGPAMVIDAIAAGRDAAKAMDDSLRAAKGEKLWTAPDDGIQIPYEIDAEVKERPQAAMPEVSPAARKKDFREVEMGYTLETAQAEARRCLRCDVK